MIAIRKCTICKEEFEAEVGSPDIICPKCYNRAMRVDAIWMDEEFKETLKQLEMPDEFDCLDLDNIEESDEEPLSNSEDVPLFQNPIRSSEVKYSRPAGMKKRRAVVTENIVESRLPYNTHHSNTGTAPQKEQKSTPKKQAKATYEYKDFSSMLFGEKKANFPIKDDENINLDIDLDDVDDTSVPPVQPKSEYSI